MLLSMTRRNESKPVDACASRLANPPRLPPVHLPRRRLVETLLESAQRLRLLCAPVGYGKTALLNECLRQHNPEHYLWLDLEGRALTLAQFCQRLVASLKDKAPEVRDPRALLAWLEHNENPWWLVLDDYPAQSCPELDGWIERLLRSQGAVQLWVSSRQRPNWKLARLMLEGQLLELGAGQLAFDREEFEQVVRLLDPAAETSTRDRLWRQTHGWCAGAFLLLNPSGRQERAGELWMRDYLGGELLARVDADERKLLLGIAHLPRVSMPLCQQLWPDIDAGCVFHRLLQSQSFFAPLDDEAHWYRLLPAVAQALQGELSTAGANHLRLSACRLLCNDGFVDEAIELALSIGYVDVAACYMERLTLDWLLIERNLFTWLDWRARLPLRLLECTPNLIYMNARALLSSWRLDEAQTCIARLARISPQAKASVNTRILANWQALEGTLQGLLGNAAGAFENCESALQHLELRDWQSSFLCYSTLARVSMAAGQTTQAERLLQSCLALARHQGCLASEVLINADRIRQLILGGELAQAETLVQECLHLVTQLSGRHSLLLGRLRLLQGELYLLRGDLDASENALSRALEYGTESADPYVLHALIGLSEVQACRGDFEQARLHLSSATRTMQCAKIKHNCYQSIIVYQHLRLLARQGAWAPMLSMARAAQAGVEGDSLQLPPLHAPSLRQRIELMVALGEQGTGQMQAARQRLEALLADCERRRFGSLTREVQVALARIGAEPGSAPVLPEAPLAPYNLLANHQPASANAPRPATELTPREIGVLQLVAQGLSNQEISNELFISLNTVKAHTVHINHKLGVKRRTQAVMRAKAMGLLA
ncbi:LuxR C-terminal-related transcriptional regulator [Pseudomonas sp. WJP1]|uniref:LuxR C-terminal-related transcriptional regulator n=1 Tax=Pseudomonas sp. WJP1 TaxID=2986947 RepID=UPI00234B7ABB|nr:LuxR C-terminal-related transcriptional regulator [Pseudomonas sp. WJP1]WCM54055.1 LuxR C-terminal-related transcriptional regulator [Pseudomonas sp. WJP1]